MYALVEIKGQQFKVEQGSRIVVNKMDSPPGESLEFNTVLMISGDSKPEIGTPYLDSARVVATVGETFRGKKVIVGKFKRRKGYHRRHGHRQDYTVLNIDQITT